MKKIAVAGLIVLGVTLMGALPSDADGRHRFHGHRGHVHTRVFVGFGPSYYWGPGPYWGPYPYWYYPPPPAVVYTPPPVVVQESAARVHPAADAARPAPEQQFWYYCQSAGAYYPSVSNCPEAWVKVRAAAMRMKVKLVAFPSAALMLCTACATRAERPERDGPSRAGQSASINSRATTTSAGDGPRSRPARRRRTPRRATRSAARRSAPFSAPRPARRSGPPADARAPGPRSARASACSAAPRSAPARRRPRTPRCSSRYDARTCSACTPRATDPVRGAQRPRTPRSLRSGRRRPRRRLRRPRRRRDAAEHSAATGRHAAASAARPDPLALEGASAPPVSTRAPRGTTLPPHGREHAAAQLHESVPDDPLYRGPSRRHRVHHRRQRRAMDRRGPRRGVLPRHDGGRGDERVHAATATGSSRRASASCTRRRGSSA